MTVIMAYTGYLPADVPDLSAVPINDSNPNFEAFFFVLTFARDVNGDGNFVAQWATDTITPEWIQQLQQENPKRVFRASLAGSYDPEQPGTAWQTPADEKGWVNNATSSLLSLMDTYHLDGIDIDYEAGLDSSFGPVMAQVIQNIGQQRGSTATLAPFGSTWPYYQDLLQNETTYVSFINYQAYADESTDPEHYMALYGNLAQANPIQANSYANLGLGIDSNTESQRGLQYPDIVNNVWNSLHGRGVQCAAIWSIEDSVKNGFPVEIAIQQT
jgi:hypothetical protein